MSHLLRVLLLSAAVLLPSAAAMASEATPSAFLTEICGWQPADTVAVIPASVREIPPHAFADCRSLRTVRFASGSHLASVGKYAFLGCSSLTEIILPESVRSLGEGCFRECTALRSLVIPAGVTKVPRFMCEWDEALVSVSLPASVTDIGSHAFAYCRSLEAIAIPPRVEHIGSNLFSFCSSLREVELPASVTELESYAFSECVSLERAVLPANGRMLGELIFSGCRSLREIVELSPEIPTFDCNSTLFEPEEAELYSRCRLVTLPAKRAAYAGAPGWRLFPSQSTQSHP